MSKICIVGPSTRFLSGVSYYTIRLANALVEQNEVSVIYYRELLPKSLFPGREHVGKPLTELALSPEVAVFDGMDYNSPISWIKACIFLSNFKPDFLILQWWTSSVAHMQFILTLFKKISGFKVILEFHEVVDPLEEAILPVRIYSR
ncbi:MAG: sugar transferase, partial [Nitrososphaeria archaeon]